MIKIGQMISMASEPSTRVLPESAGKDGDNAIYGTLVLDRHGRIVSCGEAAARLLGERANCLRGRDVADFVGGLSLGGTSARYRSAYLDYLAANTAWRGLEVQDHDGRSFVRWFRLSPIVAEGQRLFLLAVHAGSAEGPQPSAPAIEAAGSR
jgi:PAS domain S-box-containing protein